jgi:uncharacterized phage protein (TIGR01671 family)
MREIKFRVWNNKDKKFIYADEFNYNNLKLKLFYFFLYVTDEEDFGKTGFSELQQYTGLKDKEGNNIYEGDILLDDNKQIHIVKFIDSVSCFCIAVNNEDCHLALYVYNEESIIIGNIHQTPELMENDKKLGDKEGIDKFSKSYDSIPDHIHIGE